MKGKIIQAVIFLAGVVLGVAGAWGIWKKSGGVGGSDLPPSPQFDSPDRVSAKFVDAIMDFCQKDYTREYLFQKYAPGGAVRMGQGQLPSPGKATYTETELLFSLVTADAATRVVWWMKPRQGEVVDEIHVVPDAGARIVDYVTFVKKNGFSPGRKLEQSASLSDIPHVHTIRCGDKELTATLQQIVWAGDFVGKMGEITLTKGDPTNPRSRQVLTEP